ncbi:SAM-dependent methyltransferase [bacterium]|nr:MAG: SAM-dependent methyltransferase [bacterium]
MYLIFRQKSTEKNAYWDGFLSITKEHPAEGLFLEIGAANPGQIEAHRKIYGKLIGIDLDLARLPVSSGIELVNADAQFLPFRDNVFDGIISHHAIEHVKDDRLFINEIKRTLKMGGFAILGTPNRKRSVQALIEAFTGERKFPWCDHQREYVKEELLELAKPAGFSSVFVHSKFLGIHSYRIIFGFSRFSRMFNKWCSFLFLVLIK